MVPWLLVLLHQEQFMASLVVFLVAGVSDALDGFIAKRFNAHTQLGAILDPIADKALLVSAYVMLSLMNLIPFWIMIVVVFRDVIIVGGFLIMFLLYGNIKMEPLKISKLNTFLQIAYILLVLFTLAFTWNTQWIITWLGFGVLISSIGSGLAYVTIWSLKTLDDPEQLKVDSGSESS